MKLSCRTDRSSRYEFRRLVVPLSVNLDLETAVLPCHNFNISCATRNAHSFYKWLKYNFQTKSHVKCPKDKIRHTAMFVSAVEKAATACHLPQSTYPCQR